ncbi:MAG: hypothetical protein E7055_01165 [Lentisphaerae bacterium]|nr:hypothetical protein [Lentisphaerota bacterium]
MDSIYDLGNRRELMIDDFLTSSTDGDVAFCCHAPTAKECIPELRGLYYVTILKMDDIFRIYYRGIVEGYDGPGNDGNPGEFTGLLESSDGLNWKKPALNIFPQAAPNAIIFGTVETHNFVPFIDRNPKCPHDERYKAVAGLCTGGGLHRFHSADGIHWNKYDLPGLFSSLPPSHKTLDSQNVCFWSESQQRYFVYFRHYIGEKNGMQNGLRSIAMSSSPDFIRWSEPVKLDINLADEHLYVSLFAPYYRAPHIFIGTPTRFFENRGGATDIALCHTRDGINICRPFPGAWILPGRDKSHWQNRSNYLAYNCWQTAEDELSFLHKSGTRYALRLDGFSSLRAGYKGGKWISRPMRYRSGTLECNAATSAGGFLKAGIMDADEKFLPGFSIYDSDMFFGDETVMTPSWNGQKALPLKDGDVFRLCFEFKECDIYSFCLQ